MFNKYKEILNRQVIVILIGTFLTVVTYSMMFPFFAIYLKEKLVLTATAASTVLMIFTGFRRQIVLLGGFLIDRFGHKKMFAIGLFIHVLFYLGFTFSTTYWQFILFASLSIFGGALTIPSVRTLMANSAPEGGKVKAFGLRAVVYNCAFSLGPVLGSIVALHSYKYLFFGCAITYFIYMLLVLMFIEEVEEGTVEKKSSFMLKEVKNICYNYPALTTIVVSIMLFFFISQCSATIPMYLKTILSYSSKLIGILFTISAVMVIVFQQIVANYCSKIGNGRSLTYALAFLTVGVATFIFTNSFPLSIIGFVLITFGELFGIPVLYSQMIEVAPEGLKGTYSGIGTFAEGLGISLGVYIGGLLFDHISPVNMWLIITVIGLLCVSYFGIVGSKVIDQTKEREGVMA